MFRFVIPFILIGIAIAVFFTFATPLYQQVQDLRISGASFNEALKNEKTLEGERDKLTQKFNTLNKDDLGKLQTLLPDNVDNIRLVLEIEKVAAPYGMKLQGIQYESSEATGTPVAASGIQQNAPASMGATPGDYGVWGLAFSSTASYSNFLLFLKDLESNLRIVDISSITFSPGGGGGAVSLPGASAASTSDIYTYGFKIKTYWLKN